MLDLPGRPADTASFSKIDFSGCSTVVAAVSGGGDSLALLFLLRDYLAERVPGTRILAVTVDHGIRPEAAAEAGAVAKLCADFDIAHRTMRWNEAKPAAGLQQAAREARYALLAQAAEEAGAGLILTGHTLDDQLETIAMRKRRGDGRGLAGIAPATLYEGRFWIVRPLLDTRREELRRYLRAKGVAWHEDPSNKDPRYERVRVRSMLAGGGDVSGVHAELIGEMRRGAAERVRLGTGAATAIRRHAQRVSPGLYRLSPGFAMEEDRAAAIYALRILLAVVGGRAQLPDASRTAALFEHLSGSNARATLSRSVVEAREEGLYLRRELRGLPSACAIRPGLIWDDRHRIEAGTGGGTEIAPFGDEATQKWANPDAEGDDMASVPAALARSALAAEPALWRGAECLGRAPAATVAGPWARLLPSFDLAPAAAVAELVGGAPLPAPPLAAERRGKP